MFAQALAIAPHLSSGRFSRMVYEHLSGCLTTKDPSLRFSELIKVATNVIVRGDIHKSMALVLGVNKLLAMAKDISGLRLIAISKVFLRLISCSIIL
jgi:hypothetical protein